MTADTFPAVFVAIYVGHVVGDHWVQSDRDACAKGQPGWPGRLACARHVATLTATKVVALLALTAATGLDTSPLWVAVGLLVDAISHYWADRRTTLKALCDRIPGKANFYALGAPRPGRDDNPSIGTGAYALDQSWHVGWLFVAALIIGGMS